MEDARIGFGEVASDKDKEDGEDSGRTPGGATNILKKADIDALSKDDYTLTERQAGHSSAAKSKALSLWIDRKEAGSTG